MLTNEMVLKIFEDYLEEDQAIEVVQTRHGCAVMLWDTAKQDWSDVKCCPTPEKLFDALLEAVVEYQEYLVLRKCDADTLDKTNRQRIERLRQRYLHRRETIL